MIVRDYTALKATCIKLLESSYDEEHFTRNVISVAYYTNQFKIYGFVEIVF